MIYLRPRGGICNRFRAIASVVHILSQAKAKTPVCVVWSDNEGVDVSLYDLISNAGVFELISFSDPRYKEVVGKFGPANPHFVNDRMLMPTLAERSEFVLSALVLDHDLYIETCLQLSDIVDYSWLIPVPSILHEVARIQTQLGAEYVAMHIRRTDNFMSWIYSPIQLFEEKIEELLSSCSSTKIYLATDDEPTKRRLSEKYADAIYVRDNVCSRYTVGGVVDAFIDLLLLARSKKVYGSYWSSFSEQASKINRIPYCCVYDSDHKNAVRRACTMLEKQRCRINELMRSRQESGGSIGK